MQNFRNRKTSKGKLCLALALLGCFLLALTACGAPKVDDCSIIHETEFGGVYITKHIDEFNDLGFAFGDSLDFSFSNGYEMTDIPYYNGYYTQVGEPLLVGYPGYIYVRLGINNGDDLWELAGLTDSDTVSVRVNEKGKYKDTQNARDLHYEDEREKYDSDEMFANFRCVTVGDLADNTLYRAASPCDNQHNRARYVDTLIMNAGVRTILNLADNEDKIADYIAGDNFESLYFLALRDFGNVKPLAMNMNFGSDTFKSKVADGMAFMLEKDGPYLVHCTEGKDRTGFVCMLIEALCGASYDEIVDDYMITYYNYYRITKEGDETRYNIIVEQVLDPMIRSMAGDSELDLQTADLSKAAEDFLIDAGMTPEDVSALRTKLTGK